MAQRVQNGVCMNRIVVADDEEEVRILVSETLEDVASELVQAEDGVAALAAAKTCHPSLLVMDWMMPGLTGIDVLRLLKQDPSTQHIPVILLTGRNQQNDREISIEAGASAFLEKPFDPAVLLACVEKLLALNTRPAKDRIP